MVGIQCHTSRGRREARPRDVYEDGAAPPGDARAGVVVDLDYKIVETVVAPKAVASAAPHGNRTVIPPVGRLFAPSIIFSDPADRQQCARPRPAIGAPPQAQQPEPSTRRAAVAFAFV